MTFSPALLLPAFPALHGLFFLHSGEPAILLGQHPFTLLLEGSSRFHTAPQPLTLSLEDPVVPTPPTAPEAPCDSKWTNQRMNSRLCRVIGSANWHVIGLQPMRGEFPALREVLFHLCGEDSVSGPAPRGTAYRKRSQPWNLRCGRGSEKDTRVVMCLNWAMCDSAPGLPSRGDPSAFFLAELI